MFRFATSRSRSILLVGVAASLFLLWLGVWGRVLTPRPRATLSLPDGNEPTAVSNDGRWIVTHVVEYPRPTGKTESGEVIQLLGTRMPTYSGPVRIWDTQTHSIAVEFLGPQDDCFVVLASTDCRFLAVPRANDDRDARVFDRDRGRELKLPISPEADAYSYELSSGGALFARRIVRGVPPESAVEVWDLESERLVQLLPRQDIPFAFSRDGSLLATRQDAAHEGLVNLWDTSTWRLLHRLNVGSKLGTLEFSPDGKRLAARKASPRSKTGDLWELTIFNLDTGQVEVHSDSVSYCYFAPTGKPVLRYAEDTTQDHLEALRNRITGGFAYLSAGRRFFVKSHWGSARPVGGLRHAAQLLFGETSEDEGSFVELYEAADGSRFARLEGCFLHKISENEEFAVCRGDDGSFQVWDLPPRRPIELQLILSALPALMLTLLLRWRLK